MTETTHTSKQQHKGNRKSKPETGSTQHKKQTNNITCTKQTQEQTHTHKHKQRCKQQTQIKSKHIKQQFNRGYI